ncbi:hypothetical protein AUK22_04615 [bacterium CG2_30_54_10]|nr:MAG: hypothetical protein AUK22_04615 [bacterium CG2_30_54_10]
MPESINGFVGFQRNVQLLQNYHLWGNIRALSLRGGSADEAIWFSGIASLRSQCQQVAEVQLILVTPKLSDSSK